MLVLRRGVADGTQASFCHRLAVGGTVHHARQVETSVGRLGSKCTLTDTDRKQASQPHLPAASSASSRKTSPSSPHTVRQVQLLHLLFHSCSKQIKVQTGFISHLMYYLDLCVCQINRDFSLNNHVLILRPDQEQTRANLSVSRGQEAHKGQMEGFRSHGWRCRLDRLVLSMPLWESPS